MHPLTGKKKKKNLTRFCLHHGERSTDKSDGTDADVHGPRGTGHSGTSRGLRGCGSRRHGGFLGAAAGTAGVGLIDLGLAASKIMYVLENERMSSALQCFDDGRRSDRLFRTKSSSTYFRKQSLARWRARPRFPRKIPIVAAQASANNTSHIRNRRLIHLTIIRRPVAILLTYIKPIH